MNKIFPSILASMTRWRDIMVYAVGGAFFALIIAPYLQPLVQTWLATFGASTADRLQLAAAIIFVLLLHVFLGTKLTHLNQILRYPPLPVAAALGFPLACLFSAIIKSTDADWSVVAAVECLYVAAWIGHALLSAAAAFGHRLVTKKGVPQHPKDGGIEDDDALIGWIEREAPIDRPSADQFQYHTIIAQRLLRRIEQGESTIALQGSFGSGKTSIGRMAATLAESERIPIIFANVSCWGFGQSLDAQEELLSEVIRSVSRHVDTFALRSLPAEYVGAVGSHVGWYGAFLRLLTGKRSPQRVLQQLSPILSAIRKRVVLFIEDADRNFPTFDISQLEALLMRLREVPRLSFVLCISPTQKVDLTRLCDRTEIVPPLDQRAALKLIQRTRDLMLRRFPVSILLDARADLVVEERNSTLLEGSLGYYWPPQYFLPALAASPRILKRALRRVVDAWPKMCGEVNIDDLISISVLREGAPDAFAFFQRNHRLFRPATKEHTELVDPAKTKLKESLVAEWEQIIATKNFDARSAAWLMKELCPESGGITGLMTSYRNRRQSMQSERRGNIYARRLLIEDTSGDEITDQRIFALLRDAQSDDLVLANLAEAITDSSFASDAFEEFAPALGFDRILPLLSQVYRVICNRHGALLSRDDHPGFFAPWRMVVHDRPGGFDDWLAGELRMCVPKNLRLLTDIYYFWLGADRHNFAEREHSRRAINTALKESWTNIGAAEIAQGFDPLYPYTLFHLFFTSDYQKPETVPVNKIEDWEWSAGPIAAAGQTAPAVILPQIIYVLNTAADRNRDAPRFAMDKQLLQDWFGDFAGTIVELIAKGFDPHPELGASERYIVTEAIRQARATIRT